VTTPAPKSRQLQIMEAVVALLGASGKPTGLTVHMDRSTPIWQDSLPAVVVYPAASPQGVEETVEHVRIPSTRVRRTLNFRTELRVSVAEGVAPITAVDPLYLWVVTQLAPVNSVAGAHIKGPIEVRSMSDALVEGESHFAAKAVEWEIQYDTPRADASGD